MLSAVTHIAVACAVDRCSELVVAVAIMQHAILNDVASGDI